MESVDIMESLLIPERDRKKPFEMVSPASVADSEENFKLMASFNKMFQTIKKAEERNLADGFALWALRAAIRGAMSQTNGYKRSQIVGMTGYHLLHLTALDADKGTKINLNMACETAQKILDHEEFLIMGKVEVSVKPHTALVFTFSKP